MSKLEWSNKFQIVALSTLLKRKRKIFPKKELKEENFITLSLKGEIKPKKIMGWRRTKEELFKSNFFTAEKGDFIFSKIDFRNGAFAIANKKIALTSEFPVYEVSDKLNPNYLILILRFNKVLSWFDSKSVGHSGRKRVYPSLIESFKIPLPPLSVQNHIVQIMDNAYNLKKSKETEAQRLLDSIDDYVLSELGIKLPELKDQMTFVVYADDVKGKRIDPYYYQPKFEEIEKAIENGKFEVKELKDSFENGLIKGTLPKNNEKNGEVKVLQIKNILKNGLIDTSEYLTAKNIFKQNQKIDKREIIIVITGATIGKVGLWYSNEEFYLGGDMVKFKANKRYNPYYLQAFLLSQTGQYQILREITGATNKHLSPSDIENIKIPLPPLAVQNKIAKEVKRRMQKAETLQKEAKEVLEEAKHKVEEMILET